MELRGDSSGSSAVLSTVDTVFCFPGWYTAVGYGGGKMKMLCICFRKK